MSRLEPRTLCVVTVVLLATVLGAATPGTAQPTQAVAGTQLAPDDVSLRIDIQENGSAIWEVEYRVLLDGDENATAAFESVRQDIENNESQFTGEFHDRMDATAQTAENATGREMDVRNVSVSVSRQGLPQEYGVVTYRFVWTNFAEIDGDSIRAGDALAGLFLDEETSLLMTWPEGYAAQDATPSPDDERSRTVVWNGPLDFGPGEPSIILSPQTETETGESSNTGGVGDGTTASGDSDNSSTWFVSAGLLLVVVAVGGGWVFYRRRGGTAIKTGPSDDGRGGAGAAASSSQSQSSDARSESAEMAATSESDGTKTTDADGSTGGTDGTAADDTEATPAPADDTPPWEDELLSNEERVLALIEHEGGRLKQQEVAGTLDWTDAKTSQVVRKMRDEGDLDAFRLGRENVLVLPDENDDEGDLV
ncbi:hypothetical protein GL213_06405 [Halogeometricum borinquense]|uniref:Transmembrane glycoprotein / HTH domain protein n=1 Tax=Halogeometricum borinquense TaxID=60847 RepID=A0A6C0UHX3_9EURY|nr:hypothetical protein [Halogeometricum borinquense]QIB74820.1 hypothetical protein G3I44_11340 [Halogeometricum borinquense]QIQ76182.1 hypothetical protein GL213_06405 [Halogeometricum borinquense]